MIPTLKVTGVVKLRTELRNVAQRVPDAARGVMRRSAARIVEEAKINVPEDYGYLKDSIRILKDYQGANRRLQIDIVVGGQRVFSMRDGRDIDLDTYATIIHENYASMEPGDNTKKKIAAYGNRVGAHFLTRAAEAEESKLEQRMIEMTDVIIREEMR